MKSFSSTIPGLALIAVLLCAGVMLHAAADIRVAGDQPAVQTNPNNGIQAAPNNAVPNNEGETAPLGEKKTGKGEDEEQALKHSPSVQFIAKLLGIKVWLAYAICVGLNFAVLAGFIVWGLKSNLPKMFRARTEAIRKGIEEASRASQDANTRLSEIESRLAKLDGEIAQMRAQSEAAAAQEEARIRANSEEDKRAILAAAEQEIASAVNQVRRQLKQDAAELAVAIAEKKISISAAVDRELVADFAAQLGKDGMN